MGQWITIGTARGPVQAWQSPPDGKSRGAAPKGGVVVVQEIFGVNAHIRSVADGFAAAGYLAIAPAFFDLVEQGVELDYGPAEFQRGRELVTEVGLDGALAVVEAAAKLAASAGSSSELVGILRDYAARRTTEHTAALGWADEQN